MPLFGKKRDFQYVIFDIANGTYFYSHEKKIPFYSQSLTRFAQFLHNEFSKYGEKNVDITDNDISIMMAKLDALIDKNSIRTLTNCYTLLMNICVAISCSNEFIGSGTTLDNTKDLINRSGVIYFDYAGNYLGTLIKRIIIDTKLSIDSPVAPSDPMVLDDTNIDNDHIDE